MRGRFAPSPTGRLHLGNARSALLGWLQVRAAQGKFLLRIEDLDRSRCRPEHLDELYRDLEYLGLDWDEAPLVQSQRGEVYEAALEKLVAQGKVYPCFCTRAEISRAALAPHGPADDGPKYPGTCARLSPPASAVGPGARSPALRFSPAFGLFAFEDLLRGPVCQDVAQEVGDFVVRRNDGVASYQLAVVVDDAASGITDVLRGDDLLGSTPRQLALHQALGLTPPRYCHVPLLLGETGQRLAKRDGASAICELRRNGVPAEKVMGLLARLSGLNDGRPVRAAELVASFSLERLPREPCRVGQAELLGTA